MANGQRLIGFTAGTAFRAGETKSLGLIGWAMAMDPQNRLLPIEVVIVVAINLMVVAFGYHLYRLWDLFWN